LSQLESRVRGISGATVHRPRPLPGLTKPRMRLEIAVPHSAADGLRSEFDSALVFEPDAELRY
jgi:hypothetical protein